MQCVAFVWIASDRNIAHVVPGRSLVQAQANRRHNMQQDSGPKTKGRHPFRTLRTPCHSARTALRLEGCNARFLGTLRQESNSKRVTHQMHGFDRSLRCIILRPVLTSNCAGLWACIIAVFRTSLTIKFTCRREQGPRDRSRFGRRRSQ